MTPGKKGKFTASFVLPDTTDAIALKFLQGKKEDNNGGNGYFFPVKGRQGQDLKGTAYSMSVLCGGFYPAGIENANQALAEKYLKQYLEGQDATSLGYTNYLMHLTRLKDTAAVCSLLARHKEYTLREDDYYYPANLANRFCKNKALADAITQHMIVSHPQGNWRFKPWYDSLSASKTMAEQFVWLKAFEMAYPNDEAAKEYAWFTLGSTVIYSAANQMDAGVFAEMDRRLQPTKFEKQRLASLYNSFAWKCVTKDTLLPLAAQYSAKSLQLLDMLGQTLEGKYPFYSKTTYRQNLRESYFSNADTYGYILYKLGKYDSASHYLNLAAEGKQWKNSEINGRFFDALEKTALPAQVLDKMDLALENDGYIPAMEAQYLRVAGAAGVANPGAQLAAKLAAAKEKKYRKLRSKMIDQEAPAFALSDLSSKQVSLASLKGKMVVLDFWATWCGPCIASFPGMQKVVAANKSNPNLEILFMNTWQNEPDEVTHVKEWAAKNPYTFHIVMDAEDKVVKAYGVDGIPTKFVIDKNGRIRFKSVGYNGSTDKTFEEMQMMIEVAAEAGK